MKKKTLAVAAAIALAAVTAAPASANRLPSGCEIHFETILGGICVPTP